MTTRMAAGNSRQAQQMMWSHNKVNMDTTTKNIMEANDAIQALGNMLNLTPHIQSKAKELYKEYESKRVASMRKATSRPLMVAIIYIACNQEGFGRSFKELAKASGVVEKEIRSFYKSLTKILPNSSTPPLDPAALVDRYCARLGDDLPEWVKIGASQIAKKASAVIEGRQPSTVAAGSILLATSLAGIPLDQDAIAKATNAITGSTVHAAYIKLSQHKADVVPSEFMTRLQQFKATNAPKTMSSAPASAALSTATSSSYTFVTPKLPYAAAAPTLVKTEPGASAPKIPGASPAGAPVASSSAPFSAPSAAPKPVPLTSVPKSVPSTSAPTAVVTVKTETVAAIPTMPALASRLSPAPSAAPATASV